MSESRQPDALDARKYFRLHIDSNPWMTRLQINLIALYLFQIKLENVYRNLAK
jgi:hypothetical protein